MDFATVPGGNPFLMNDDDFSMPNDTSLASNPFLAEDFSMPAPDPALNPFLMGGDEFQSEAADIPAGTNPFAMFGVEDEPQPTAADPAPTADFFGGSLSQPDFFVPQEPPIQDTLIFSPERPPPPRPAPPPAIAAVPTSLNLTGSAVEYQQEITIVTAQDEPAMVPNRPPPPRPVPPSKETVQLIQSVTGAMEATSSDLLDRLQANRTPSPTPIRDLHSPSPTPDMLIEENDLLMDTTPAPQPAPTTMEQPQTAASFMDIFGDAASVPIVEEMPPESPIVQQSIEESVVPQQPVNMAPQQSTDVFGLFGDQSSATTHAAPPPRPTPPVVVMQLTPPEDANLIGDLSSPGNGTSQVQSTETPIAFAAEPRRPPPPKVPPRPPSPAAPQPPSAFPAAAFSPPSETPKPPTVLTPPEQVQPLAQEAPMEEPDEFDSFNDAFSAKFESAGAKPSGGDAFYNAFGATVGLEETDGA